MSPVKLISFTAACILACFSLTLYSCLKKPSGNGTYIIQGYVYTDCSYTPVSGAKVALEFRTHRAKCDMPEVESVVTDNNGFFKMQYSNDCMFGLYEPDGYFTVNGMELYNMSVDKNYYLSIFYKDTSAYYVKITPKREFAAGDTLFYGRSEKDYATLSPIISYGAVIGMGNKNTVYEGNEIDKSTHQLSYAWRIGRKEYMDSVRWGTSTHRSYVSLYKCTEQMDTLYINAE